MPLPTFVVIGAAKCGSTSLCALLAQHPDVYVTYPKEPNYFSRFTAYDQGRDWYESLYADARGVVARGEGSTTYTNPIRCELTATRLREAVPDCRLLYIVRHPIRRLESGWKMRRRGGDTAMDINRTAEKDVMLVAYGLYWQQLSTYLRLFPSDQILVVFLEDFVRSPVAVLGRAYAHIGVDPGFKPHNAHAPQNAAAGFRDVTGLGAIIRRLPGFDIAKQLAPRGVLEKARRMFTVPRAHEVEWDPQILRDIASVYRDDSKRLLEYCGKPDDYWELEH